MSDLKPCPFCGGEAIPPQHDHARMWVIRCQGCNVEVWDKNDGHSETDFILMIAAAWNTRAALAEIKGERAMSDNDLIRRGDALDAAWDADSLELSTHGAGEIEARINAIPAVQPTVSPELLATTNDVAALVDAVENLLIGIGMGWDLDGVCEVTTAALARVKGVM